MNRMTEEDIKIITKEEYLNDEGTEQKRIFDSNIFDKIKGKELNLSVEKIFKIPTIKNIFTRKKVDYNDYTYRDIDTEENLEIINDR